MKRTILTLTLIFSILFSGVVNSYALSNPLSFSREKPTNNADKGDNPLKIVIEPSEESMDLDSNDQKEEKLSMEDIFGSEQVFPFEPGFS